MVACTPPDSHSKNDAIPANDAANDDTIQSDTDHLCCDKESDTTTNNNGLVNDGMETETDYLGCNDKSDEVMVDHLLDMMSENENWVNKYDSNEYTPPPQGTKFIELESFKAFSNEKSNVYFWQDYICSQEDEICGGFRGIVWRSMFKRQLYDSEKFQRYQMRSCCLI